MLQPFRYSGYSGYGYRGADERDYIYTRLLPEVLALLQNGRPIRLGIENTNGYNPLQLQNYVEYTEAMNGADWSPMGGRKFFAISGWSCSRMNRHSHGPGSSIPCARTMMVQASHCWRPGSLTVERPLWSMGNCHTSGKPASFVDRRHVQRPGARRRLSSDRRKA